MIKRIVLPMLVVALVAVFIQVLVRTNPWIFVDAASFVLVPMGPLVFMGLSAGWKGFASAFRAAMAAGATKRELSLSVRFFESLGLALWSFGAIGTASGFVVVLADLTDRSKLGPNLAIALITMLYAALFNAVLVLPFLALAKRRFAEAE